MKYPKQNVVLFFFVTITKDKEGGTYLALKGKMLI